MTQRYATGVIATLTFLALLCVAYMVPTPYIRLAPGPAFNALGKFGGKPMFTIEGAPTYKTSGALSFTTVEVTNAEVKVTLGEAMLGVVSGDDLILPRELLYPEGSTAKDSDKQSAEQLESSKQVSRVAALRAAGFTVGEVVVVDTVVKGAPADGLMRTKDLVLAVDGQPITSASAAADAVGKRTPGAPVSLTVERDGQQLTVDITTRDDHGKARVGLSLRSDYRLPVTITNNVDDSIGGASAGTMFALAIYDMLTPGELTGGLKVAGTGTIDGDGTVGPIGGVHQKVVGAARTGATVFLVPAENCAEALDGDDRGLRLVKVSTLKGAIAALAALADDPQAKVPACTG